MNTDTDTDTTPYGMHRVEIITLYGVFVRQVKMVDQLEQAGIEAKDRMGLASLSIAQDVLASPKLAEWSSNMYIESYRVKRLISKPRLGVLDSLISVYS